MFNKTINMTITKDDYEVLNDEFVKTASEVVLPDGYTYDPDFLYIKVRGISAGETYGCNKNGDYFGREELKANYKTFLDAHVFKNHENKDVEKAIGDVMDAVWNDEMDYVELFIRINRKVAPTIVAGFEKGYMTDVSMGCRVHHTICSICGNRAKTPAQYCEHIRKNKHEIYPDGRKVFEINIAPKFHDISAVLNGADRTAKMTAMYVPAEKRAQLEREWGMNKVASHSQSRFRKSLEEIEMEKVAFEHCIQDDLELFEKKASSKQDALEKIAEIKKRIKGNVLRIARSRQELKDESSVCRDFDEIVENSPIMGLEQMDNVSSKLLEISERENMPASKLLAIFLKLSMASGRIFSPSEVVGLMKRISRCPHTEITPNFSGRIMSSAPTLLGGISGHSHLHNMPIGLNGIISAIGRVFGGIHQSPSLNMPVSEPITRSRIVIMKLASDSNENLTKQASVIEEVAKLATENIYCKPTIDYRSTDMATDMFMILQEPETLSQSIEQLAYSVYLDEMTKYANSKEFGFDREYYINSEIEKTARLNTWNWTVAPGMAGFAYGRYQGARARKGESLSSFERATAENPEVAAGTAAIAGNAVARSLNSIPQKISNGLVRARRVMHRIAMDEVLDMEKVSNDVEYENYFEKNFDMFNNDTIDGYLVSLGYSESDIGRLKTASVLYAYERADVCDNLLKSANLNYDDVETFLKIAIDYAEAGLEKHAGIIGKVKKGIQVSNPTLNTLANISGTMFLGEYALRGGKKLKDIIGAKIDPKTQNKVRTNEHLADEFFDEIEKMAEANAMKLIMDVPYNIIHKGGSRELASKVRHIGGRRSSSTVARADKMNNYYRPLVEKAKKDASMARLQRMKDSGVNSFKVDTPKIINSPISSKPISSKPISKPISEPISSKPISKPISEPISSKPISKPISEPITSRPTSRPISSKPISSKPISKPSGYKKKKQNSRKPNDKRYDRQQNIINNQNTPKKGNKALLYGGVGAMGVGSAILGKGAYDTIKNRRRE